jgi:hypothetical protein
MSGAEYSRLLRMICMELPKDWLVKVAENLGQDESDSISFEEFAAGLSAAFMYKECCADALSVFKAVEVQGRVDRTVRRTQELLTVMEKLTQQADFKLPSRGDISSMLPAEVTSEVFLSAVLKCLVD